VAFRYFWHLRFMWNLRILFDSSVTGFKDMVEVAKFLVDSAVTACPCIESKITGELTTQTVF